MYEHRDAPLLSRAQFGRRILGHLLAAIGLVGVSLAAGIVGFAYFEPTYSWLDAYVNAAMLLGGMGQVGPLNTPGGKIFAGTFALFAGLVLVGVTGLMLAPLLHRMMHTFHWTEQDEGDQ